MLSSESDFEIDEVNNLVYIMTLNKAYFYHIITSVVRKWKTLLWYGQQSI